MKFYIAAPLCSEAERRFNEEITALVEGAGFSTYLPQRDAGFLDDLVAEGRDEEEVRQGLYRQDCSAMDECDAILLILDGRTVDEGACFELGYMAARGKRCLGLKTDPRTYIRGRNNLMLEGALESLCRSREELSRCLQEMAATLGTK